MPVLITVQLLARRMDVSGHSIFHEINRQDERISLNGS